MDINGLSTGMASGHDEPLALANKGYISENLAARPTDIEKRHKNVQTKERQ